MKSGVESRVSYEMRSITHAAETRWLTQANSNTNASKLEIFRNSAEIHISTKWTDLKGV